MGRLGRTKGISPTESDFLKGPNQKFHLMLVCVWTRIQSQPLLDRRKERKSLSFLQKEEDPRIRGIKQQSLAIFLHVFFITHFFSFHSDFLLCSIEIIPARVISKPYFVKSGNLLAAYLILCERFFSLGFCDITSPFSVLGLSYSTSSEQQQFQGWTLKEYN